MWPQSCNHWHRRCAFNVIIHQTHEKFRFLFSLVCYQKRCKTVSRLEFRSHDDLDVEPLCIVQKLHFLCLEAELMLHVTTLHSFTDFYKYAPDVAQVLHTMRVLCMILQTGHSALVAWIFSKSKWWHYYSMAEPSSRDKSDHVHSGWIWVSWCSLIPDEHFAQCRMPPDGYKWILSHTCRGQQEDCVFPGLCLIRLRSLLN